MGFIERILNLQEEISRAKNLRRNNGSVSGSVEELAATPAVRSRASSARSDTQRPEPTPRPPHLTSHPQHLVVYQPAWQQSGMVVSFVGILSQDDFFFFKLLVAAWVKGNLSSL